MATTTVIQPSNADTFIASVTATTNYGTLEYINVGYDTKRYRGLLKFDLSSIPVENCVSAVISLWAYSDSANQDSTIYAHRLLRNWGETTATYNIYMSGTPWQYEGAAGELDIDSVAMGQITVANNKSLGEWQIALNPAEFKKMYDGTYTNYGWLLKSSEENTSLWGFRSREYGTAAERPKLTVVTGVEYGGSVAMLSDYGIL